MSLNTPPTETVDSKTKFGKNYKLKEEDKQIIVSMWATGLTPTEVKHRAKEELNISISAMQIVKYSRAEKWQKLIANIRKETFADLAAVAGSHKRVRLDRAERIYEKAMSKNKFKDALAATAHQQKEMEGGGDFNITLNQFNVLSDEELEAKKAEIIQRIALKQKGVIDVIPTVKTEATGT